MQNMRSLYRLLLLQDLSNLIERIQTLFKALKATYYYLD